jgi:hypothetical protein
MSTNGKQSSYVEKVINPAEVGVKQLLKDVFDVS